MTVSLPLFLGLVIVCVLTWAGWVWAEVRSHNQAADLRRARADLAAARHEIDVLSGWYLTASDQVIDAERRFNRLQRDVDGAGVLVVPGHALANASRPKLFLN